MIGFYERAAILVALFLFLSSSLGWTKKIPENLETFQDQILKSQVLLLQRDRNQASQILIGTIAKEGLKSVAFPELKRALKKTAELFFSEKAQQSYEVAIADYNLNRAQAAENLKEALKIEPMNGSILKSLSFALLAIKECQQSQKYLSDLLKINPFDPDIENLQTLIFICQNNRTQSLENLNKVELSSVSPSFLIVNRFRVSAFELNKDSNTQKLDDENPELLYVAWALEKDLLQKRLLSEKYKNLCHKLPSFDKAYHWMDPWVCDHVKEIDEFRSRSERSN
ncbi:MAG: hypothetical protein RJB66_2337 [Pseudomonadota bacterium]|jgi:tetratricopeptide (TPR) repeat protein